MKYVYPLEPNADITEGLDDRVVDMLLNHRDKINKIVEVINSNFHLEEPESRLTTTEAQQIEMANDFRDILRPYHKEGEYYTATLKRVLFSPEKKEEVVVKVSDCCGKSVIPTGYNKNGTEVYYECSGCKRKCYLKSKIEKQEPTQEDNLFSFEEIGYLLSRYLYEDSEIYRRVKSKIERLLK